MQYFVQAFSVRQPYPDKYDLLMDIATEELSHLEIVGASITMLLDGVNGELKNAAEKSNWMTLMKGSAKKEQLIHQALVNPQFLAMTGAGPPLNTCTGVPLQCSFGVANSDPPVDRSTDHPRQRRDTHRRPEEPG